MAEREEAWFNNDSPSGQPTDLSDYFPTLARAALSVPALAEVIARDAKVREIVSEWAADEWANSDDRMGDIASVVEGEMK